MLKDQTESQSRKFSSSSRSRCVHRRRIRFWPNLNRNSQYPYRSKRFFIRNTNMQTISAINSYTVQIDGNEKMLRNFNCRLRTQFATKTQTTNGYIIYKLYSTQSLSQFDRLLVSISDLFLMSSDGGTVRSSFKSRNRSKMSVQKVNEDANPAPA